MATAKELITQIYVGYFDRAPDPAGLNYWIGRYNDGMTLAEIAQSFSVQPESTSNYPYLANPNVASSTTFIQTIYLNLFNRTADAEGLAYWEAELANGKPVGQMILDIISGAVTNPDKAILDNKVAVGIDWVETAANVPGFDYDAAAAASAEGVLDNVDETAASVDAAKAETDAYFASAPSNPGEVFTLTTGTDLINGTAGDDTILAPDNGTDTISSFDQINGGAGVDTLRVAGAQDLSVADITNVEIVRVEGDAAATYSADDVGGLQRIEFAGNTVALVTVDDLDEGQAVGLVGASGAALDANYEDAATAASVVLNNVSTAGTTVTVDGAGLETLNVSGSTVATIGNALEIENGGASDIDTLNVTSTGFLRFVAGAGLDVENVNLNGAADTRARVDLTAIAAADLTVTGGAGREDVTVDFADLDNNDSIDLGAGDQDRVVLTNVAVTDLGSLDLADEISNVEKIAIDAPLDIDGQGTVVVDFSDLGEDVTALEFWDTVDDGAVSAGDSLRITELADGATVNFSDGVTAAVDLVEFRGDDNLTISVEGADYLAAETEVRDVTDLTINFVEAAVTGDFDLTSTSVETISVVGGDGASLALDLADADEVTSVNLSGFDGSFDIISSGEDVTFTLNNFDAASTIQLDAGAETIEVGSNVRFDLTIDGFQAGVVGADVLDLSALGVAQSDLTFTYDGANLEITSSKFAGMIELLGVNTTDIAAGDIVYA